MMLVVVGFWVCSGRGGRPLLFHARALSLLILYGFGESIADLQPVSKAALTMSRLKCALGGCEYVI